MTLPSKSNNINKVAWVIFGVASSAIIGSIIWACIVLESVMRYLS